MQQFLIKQLVSLFLFSFLVCSFTTSIALGQLGKGSSASSEIKSKIVTGTSVRVRAEPKLSAKEVARLNVGTVVKLLERSAKKDKVGQKEDYWYKVNTTQVQKGWVFGGFLLDYDINKREIIYLKIASDRLKIEGADFDDYADLYNFLNGIDTTSQSKTKNASTELEFYKLQALAKSLEKIPFEKQSQTPYRDWTKKHDAEITYSEPAGQWFVRSDLFWDLSARSSRTLPIGERIAWAAAKTPLPGECEGYLPCHIHISRITLGEYLKRYPQGDHAEEAMRELSEWLAPVVADLSEQKVYNHPQDETERKEMRQHIMQLRAILKQSYGTPAQQIVMNQLDQISKAYP